jgi:carbon storage regulator
MLVLTRKVGESIQIGDGVFITIRKSSSSRVSISIDAPRNTRVLRTEIAAKIICDVVPFCESGSFPAEEIP